MPINIPQGNPFLQGRAEAASVQESTLNQLLKQAELAQEAAKTQAALRMQSEMMPYDILSKLGAARQTALNVQSAPILNAYRQALTSNLNMQNNPALLEEALKNIPPDPNNPLAMAIYSRIGKIDLTKTPSSQISTQQQKDINKANISSAETLRDSSSNIPTTWNKINEAIDILNRNKDLTGFLKGSKFISSISNNKDLSRLNQIIAEVQADTGKLISGTGHTTNFALDLAKLTKLDPNATPAWNAARLYGLRKDLADLYESTQHQHQILTKQDLPIEMPESYHAYKKAKNSPDRLVDYQKNDGTLIRNIPYSEAVKMKERGE